MCENGTDMSKLSGIFNLTDIKESLAIAESLATTALMTSPAAKRRLMARKLEMGLDSDLEFVPPKQVLLYLVRWVKRRVCLWQEEGKNVKWAAFPFFGKQPSSLFIYADVGSKGSPNRRTWKPEL